MSNEILNFSLKDSSKGDFIKCPIHCKPLLWVKVCCRYRKGCGRTCAIMFSEEKEGKRVLFVKWFIVCHSKWEADLRSWSTQVLAWSSCWVSVVSLSLQTLPFQTSRLEWGVVLDTKINFFFFCLSLFRTSFPTEGSSCTSLHQEPLVYTTPGLQVCFFKTLSPFLLNERITDHNSAFWCWSKSSGHCRWTGVNKLLVHSFGH